MLPKEIQRLFNHVKVEYQVVKHSPYTSVVDAAIELNIDPSRIAVTSLVQDKEDVLMLIYPANAQLDIATLNEKLKRQFKLVTHDQIKMNWPTYYNGQCIPLSLVYNLSAEVHVSFSYGQSIYFPISNSELCCISSEAFSSLQRHAMYDDFFALMPEKQQSASDGAEKESRTPNAAIIEGGRKQLIREQLKKITSLPAMPTIAQRLLQLSGNPYASARDLAIIIEQDPSLSAQLIRYANSPLYGFKGEVNSIRDVITRVMGFDLVMDMALGVSVGRMFKNPKEGKLGLNEFWRHATYCAALTEKLATRVNGSVKPRPGIAYLAGLLHNFGLLLLGHLFPQDFVALNKAASRYPGNSIIELEHTLIGVTHMELGVSLMQAWNMPDEIIVTIREHHNPLYHDIHSVYANLVLLANRLLNDVEIGDEESAELPAAILESLALCPADAKEVFDQVLGIGQGLESIALQMAA